MITIMTVMAMATEMEMEIGYDNLFTDFFLVDQPLTVILRTGT